MKPKTNKSPNHSLTSGANTNYCKEYSTYHSKLFYRLSGIQILPFMMSAKTGEGINEAFTDLAKEIMEKENFS